MKKMAEGSTPEEWQEELSYIAGLLRTQGAKEVPREYVTSYLDMQAGAAEREGKVFAQGMGNASRILKETGDFEKAYQAFMAEAMGGGLLGTEGSLKTAEVKVYDNGGVTADRYTVIIDGSVFTMSENAMQANGVNMYAGEVSEGLGPSAGDQEISVDELPDEVRRAIEMRKQGSKTAKSVWEDEFDPGAKILVSSPTGDFEAIVDSENPDGTLHVTTMSGVGMDVNIVDVVRKLASGEFLGGWQTNAEELEIGDQVEVQKEVNGFRGEVIPAGSVGTVSQLYTYGAGVVFEEGGEIVTGYDFLKKVGMKTAAGPPANTVHWGTVLDAAGNTYEVYVDSSEWGESGTGEKQYFGWTTLIDETGKESYFGALEQLESQIAAGGYTKVAHKTAAWQDWESAQGVEVATKQGADIFDSLEEAQKVYPTLDPEKNTKDFTWAMAGQDGRMRFESWEMYEMLSSSKKAGRADDEGVTEGDVEPKQLDMGREVEKEHHDDCPSVDNEALATEISLDHLSELPDYYDRLKQMEEEGKTKLKTSSQAPPVEQETGNKTRWCELCQNPAGEFDDVAWEKRLHLCDMCLHEGFGEKKIWDLAASRQKKSDLVPPEITEIIELFRNTGVEDFQTWEGIAPGEWKITWQDDETKLPYLLTVSPNGWTFVAEEVHVQRRGFDYPPKWDDLQSVWGEARNAWEALHSDEYQPIPGAAPYMGRSTVDPGSMLAGGEAEPGRYGVMSGLGSIVPPIKMAGFDDETVSPLHRFYQERNIPGDPQRLALEAAVSRVHEVLGKFNKFLRLMGIQFERIEAIRYAGTDKHIDRGRVWLKAQVVAGAPIARRATLSVVVTIKDGEVCDAAEFIDASQKHRLLNEASLKAYLNLQETPAVMRAPNVERAQIDRTILPPTPAKSLFHGRGGVDA